MGLPVTIRLTPKQLEQRRLAAIQMIQDGKTQSDVARELNVTTGAVNHWVQAYEKGGEEALKRRPHTGRPPKLTTRQQEQLAEMLLDGAEAHGFETDVWTLERVATVIQDEYDVTYHPHHISKLLQRLGFTWKKPQRLPINRDEETIQEWVKEEWPRLKNGQRSSEQ